MGKEKLWQVYLASVENTCRDNLCEVCPVLRHCLRLYDSIIEIDYLFRDTFDASLARFVKLQTRRRSAIIDNKRGVKV